MSVFEEEVIVLCSGAGHFTLLAQLVIGQPFVREVLNTIPRCNLQNHCFYFFPFRVALCN